MAENQKTPDQAHYFAVGPERSWVRKDHDPIGFKLLVDWMLRNSEAIESLTVTFDPDKVQPDPTEMWTMIKED